MRKEVNKQSRRKEKEEKSQSQGQRGIAPRSGLPYQKKVAAARVRAWRQTQSPKANCESTDEEDEEKEYFRVFVM